MEYLKNHWLEITAIIIAIISTIFAFGTWRASFLLTHRPFLWVESFAYRNEQKAIPLINTVMIKVLNSPAEITSGKYYYYILEGSNKKTIDDQPTEKSIKYPSDMMQYTHTAAKVTEYIVNNLKPTEKLIRFIRLEYKWLSSNRKYFFEGEWEYNKSNKKWEVIYQKAN